MPDVACRHSPTYAQRLERARGCEYAGTRFCGALVDNYNAEPVRRRTLVKHTLGHLCYGIMIAFGAGLFLTMARIAWGEKLEVNAFLAFFGFGIPMVLLGIGAAALWSDDKRLTQRFGWTCTVGGLVWALGLLYLLAGWVGLVSPVEKVEFVAGAGHVLAFGIPMIVCGAVGIAVLLEPPGQQP